MDKLKDVKVLSSLIIGVAIIISGFTVSATLHTIKSSSNYVAVKGLSERQIKADLALWPIRFTAAGDDLTQIYSQINSTQKTVVSFLTSKGFSKDEIHLGQPKVTDKQAQLYSDTSFSPKRYIAEGTVLVRSNKVDAVTKSLQEIGELVGKGVTLSSGGDAEFLFTKLNDIKPEMIEEATKQARIAAEKFAKDSGSRVKGIKNAYQGLFSVEPIHYYTPEIKVVRVVTDIDYLVSN